MKEKKKETYIIERRKVESVEKPDYKERPL